MRMHTYVAVVAMCSVMVAVLCSHFAMAATPDQLTGTCRDNNGSYYFVPGLWKCASCPLYARANSEGACDCNDGFAAIDPRGTCLSCAAQGLGVSFKPTTDNFEQCLPCGGSSTASLLLVNATFSVTHNKCECPSGYVIVEDIGGVRLGAQMCAPCTTSTSPTTSNVCTQCTSPYIYASGACVCGTGYTMLSHDGLCVLSTTLTQLYSGGSGAVLTIAPLNVDNTGTTGTAVTSAVVSNHLASALYRCSLGNQSACNLLANLCVLSWYDTSSSPCSLIRSLQSTQSPCRGLACEIPTTVPWLYYLRSSSEILQESSSILSTTLEDDIEFILSTYDWDGTWLGNSKLVDQISMCEMSSGTAVEFYKAGTNRLISCFANLRWVLTASKTKFYELFILHKSTNTLRPVPVLVDTSSRDLDPSSIFDESVRSGGVGVDGTPAANGYRRRFFLYDNVAGIPLGGSTKPEFITVARRMMIVMTIKSGTSSLYSPLLIVQYQSTLTAALFAAIDTSSLGSLNRFMNNASKSHGDGTMDSLYMVKTTVDNDKLEEGLMVTLIVVSCLCFFSAWTRTYGWMRRQQMLMLDFDVMGRFVLYMMNHLSNIYTLVVVITTWYIFIAYKFQFNLQNAAPETSRYILPMLYTAVAAKGCTLIAKLIEQTNADVYVIDWERSKGQLLRENKMAPVSLWRSAFVVNEFNELQTLRRWRPLLSMMIVVLFLDGLNYVNAATSVPTMSDIADATSHPNAFLRIAICTFFWIVVCLVLHVLEFQIYYRFVKVHPLQAFIDLCSVSNISVMVLLEPQWGFYIHGESIHAHADVSVEEFQENLFFEAQGNLPTRGLGGNAQCQTFEVFLSTVARQYLNVKYAELQREFQIQIGGASGPPHIGHHRRIFEFLFGMPGLTRLHTPNAIAIKTQLNNSFKNCVRAAEKLVLPKFGMHALFDFPPNIMYMNGPFAGEGNATGGKDLFFLDDSENYGSSLLYGIDADLCIFYMLLFVAIDSSLLNVYASMVITYVIEWLVMSYRATEGTANLGRKTLIDDRFFV